MWNVCNAHIGVTIAENYEHAKTAAIIKCHTLLGLSTLKIRHL